MRPEDTQSEMQGGEKKALKFQMRPEDTQSEMQGGEKEGPGVSDETRGYSV